MFPLPSIFDIYHDEGVIGQKGLNLWLRIL
jgi:hypothetical protein